MFAAQILFVVGGEGTSQNSISDVSAVDVSGSNRQCDAPNQFPYDISLAVGYLDTQ